MDRLKPAYIAEDDLDAFPAATMGFQQPPETPVFQQFTQTNSTDTEDRNRDLTCPEEMPAEEQIVPHQLHNNKHLGEQTRQLDKTTEHPPAEQ